MPKPQDHDGDEAAEIDEDLKLLNEMNIDEDFNVWSDFRKSFCRNGQKESIRSLVTKSQLRASRTFSDESLDLDSIGEEIEDEVKQSLEVTFSTLTPGEQRDIRAWNKRLSRDTIYSRYYFPEAWEMRELKSIGTYLELQNPRESPGFLKEKGLEGTKAAITSIFYPGDHDPKSVLLKRGPILFDGTEERELIMFTHGCLLSRMEFDTLLNLIFTINSENPEFLSQEALKERFNAIDTDGSGCLDRCELKEVFSGMGVPISEKALSDIMDRFDDDNDGTIDFAEFERVIHEGKPKKKERRSLFSLVSNLGGGGGQTEVKVECAWQFSDIEMIESTNVCSSEATDMFGHSSWADLVLAIYVKGREAPLILVCSKPEQREAWVEAFCTCYVKSIKMRASNGYEEAKKISSQVGWQHLVIRASLFSLVVCNDLAGLKDHLDSPPRGMHIDDQDDYLGYTLLHYAVVLGNLECAKILLVAGARVTICDNGDKTALDHAVLLENEDAVELLEHYGAKTNSSNVLFKGAVEEQEKLKNEQPQQSMVQKTIAKGKGATAAMSQAMSALKERGEKIERLDNKAAQLQDEASNYADMAKKLKEKNKKKSTFFGM